MAAHADALPITDEPLTASGDLMSLAQFAALLPRRPGGAEVHLGTIYRWMNGGVRGVRLEFIQCGGSRYVTRAMLRRFMESLTVRIQGPAGDEAMPPCEGKAPLAARSPAARRKAIARAEAELDRRGV